MVAVLAIGLVALGWLGFGAGSGQTGGVLLVEEPGARVEAVDDAEAGTTLGEVRAWPEAVWRPWQGRGYLTAPPGRVIWLRVRLENPAAEPVTGMLTDTSYFSDRVELWSEQAGVWQRQISGGGVAGGVKPWRSRMAAFPVWLPARSERVLYLRISDGYIPHMQPIWWARAGDFFDEQTDRLLLQTLCIGAMLALVFYNGVLWLRLRFADTGYYVLTAAAGVAFNFTANGGWAQLGVPFGSPWRETLMTALLGLGAVSVVKFTRVFLGTESVLPRVDLGLRRWWIVLVVLCVTTPGMLVMTSPLGLSVMAVAGVLTDAFCLMAAVAAWRRGARHARFYLAAFAFLALAGVPALISVVRGEVGVGVALGLLVGRTMEMLLLSFAVADRFAQTQRRLIEETEQRRMIEETYAEELEIEVRERTRELAEANADKDRMLAVIGHDLRGPLTGLMRAADATAGPFAREMSRTGRMLLLLIEDLVLWARLRAGRSDPGVHAAAAITAPAVALHHAIADRGGIELAVDVPAGLSVRTDLVLAQTLVRNLLANALKFARGRVALRAEPGEDGGTRFTVLNDGGNLPEDVAARFAAGQDEPMTATGGLGLRLCREICRALETKLQARRVEGGGAEFWFVLEIARVNPPPETHHAN